MLGSFEGAGKWLFCDWLFVNMDDMSLLPTTIQNLARRRLGSESCVVMTKDPWPYTFFTNHKSVSAVNHVKILQRQSQVDAGLKVCIKNLTFSLTVEPVPV